MAVSPDESALFVVNANSELRYDSGSLGVIDLTAVQPVIAAWTASRTVPSNCIIDPDHSETLQCDEAQFFKVGAGVRVGNFATDLAVQDFTASTGKLRLFVPTRGDPSVAWADYDGQRLSCTSGNDTYALCDDAHRLTSLDNDPNLALLPAEPFGVFADSVNGFATVTHLETGSVTLINAPADSSQVQIVDMISNVFAPDIVNGTGLRGATGVAGRSPTAMDADTIYVSSNTENRIQTFNIGKRDGAASYLLPGPFFFLDAVGSAAGMSFDSRGIRFSSDGNRLYLVNRMPPALQVYDTSMDPTGIPLNQPIGSSDVCREASMVAVIDPGAGVPMPGQSVSGDRVYVTCFQDGQVYVVNPSGQSFVEDIISVGRGPYAAVAVGQNTPHKQLFVSNFLEDTIAVIDLSIDSPTRDRVVLRIGTPRAP